MLLCRMVGLGQDPLPAVSPARLHHQLLPNAVAAEAWSTKAANFTVGQDVVTALERRKHEVAASDWGAVCQVIAVNPETGALISVSRSAQGWRPSRKLMGVSERF